MIGSGSANALDPEPIMVRRVNIQGISIGSIQMFEAMNPSGVDQAF